MPSCAFLTLSDRAGWIMDDDLVHPPLKKLGWEIQNIPWDANTDWASFNVVVIRSCWDYHHRLNHFLEVLDQIVESGATLLNSRSLLLWNLQKQYLTDLGNMGIEVVPTVRQHSLNQTGIDEARDRFVTDRLIVKPMVSASASDTFILHVDDHQGLRALQPIFLKRELMIQPFMQNIVDEGEYSLVYFDGRFSHAILKTARSGDFRVQEEHGGSVGAVEQIEMGLLAAGDKTMRKLPEVPLYARVDLVRTSNQRFALMELELVEPSLYLRLNEPSAETFARCIHDRWQRIASATS